MIHLCGMKGWLISVLFLVQILFGFGQMTTSDVFFGARGGHLDIDGFGPRAFSGFDVEYMFATHLSVHWSVQFGEDYFHMPLGPVGGIFAGLAVAASSANRDTTDTSKGIGTGLFVGLLTSFIPEGMAVHVPITPKSAISPYISPLQFEFIRRAKGQDSFAGGAAGMRLHFYADRKYTSYQIRITPFVEYKIHYHSDTHPGFIAGGSIAFAVF